MRNNNKVEQSQKFSQRPLASWVKAIALATSAAVPFMADTVMAQNVEEVVVTGTRQLIQDQIAIKRDNVGIVDGLSASDIGELPALSIGEALESITGAASHRENGGATEISIRGLGPYLSATTFNGREATNGSGDRSVNFSQFPSELMSKLGIHKTQDASMIEGGVAGVIALETLKPLDFGKRRIQVEGKLNLNPDELNVDNRFQDDIGTRFTASYVDQIEFNDMALGWSFGGQISSMAQSEAEVRSSGPSSTPNSLWACLNDPSITNEGMFSSSSDDCEDQVNVGGVDNQGYITDIVTDENDPNFGKAVSDGTDYVWTGSSRGFRQNETDEKRDSFFGAIQFQPSEQWDINLDFQLSSRVQTEDRHDLIVDSKRVQAGVTGYYVNDAQYEDDGVTLKLDENGDFIRGDNAPINHVIQQWKADPYITTGGEYASREEIYSGGGIAVTFTPTDQLTLDLDIAHSKTTREELQITTTMKSNDRIITTWERESENGVPVFTFENFDVTNPYNYQNESSALRARVDRENVRENIIDSIRFDAAYEIDMPFITNVKGGLRASSLSYLQMGGDNGNGSREELSLDTGVTSAFELITACAIRFPESDFLSSVTSGPLVTNAISGTDSNGDATTTYVGGSTYAAFDNKCLAEEIYASNSETFGYPEVTELSSGTIDVTEDTFAAYIMADYETDSGFRGNFGIRVVQTDVTSVGYRGTFSVTETVTDITDPDTGVVTPTSTFTVRQDNENITRIVDGGSYTEILPSAMFVYDLNDAMVIRGGIFRGLSRTDPRSLSNSRTFTTEEDESAGAETVEEAFSEVLANGNPEAEPFASWNTDVSFEWYPNDDALLAVGLYHKLFTGGVENITTDETFNIDGVDRVLAVVNTRTTDEESNLYGIELTATYRWDSGIGFKASYNHAVTDFEFNDSAYGNIYQDGVLVNAGIIPAASMPGFSEDTFSGQLYYQIGEFDIAAIYKYRSEYFQPFTTDGTRIRYVDASGVWEARASYRVNDYIRIKAEAINLFSEPKTQTFFQDDYLGEVNDYGPRLFVGVSAKF